MFDLGFEPAPSVEELRGGADVAETFYFTVSHERVGELESDVLVAYADTREAMDAFLATPAARSMASSASAWTALTYRASAPC